MSREDHLRRAVFQAPKLGLLLSHFPLVPPLQNFRKMADLGHFAPFARTLLSAPKVSAKQSSGKLGKVT